MVFHPGFRLMIVIGIIGGVASGKSVVTDMLKSLGAVILDADQTGHQVLLTADVKQKIRQRWGSRVFRADGEVNRRALADVVFDPEQPQELTALEKITHPSIEARIREQICAAAREHNPPALVLDAPVMVKTGWYRLCDVLLFVDCPLEDRLRYAQSRGWTPAMLEGREARQARIAQKRTLATHVIHNNGTLEQLKAQVQQVWDEITRHPGRPATRVE